ncbi:MAG: DNA cytosine methyltransferase [Chlorobi bacterium]|nr:MAG: DNA-cytosine methyltransferase [Chlorobi bacterium OLB7]MBK8910802.1 DNA cytosine methyltransferase [Chlorobiota bacterium]MBX7216068.1 DNA cytosine methyltransferase [Candidatus Kapabacteria bacterium]
MKEISNQSNKKYQINATAVDLFCGAGGLTRGLLDAGISVVAGYDIDSACCFPYEFNNHEAKFYQKNIAEITGEEIERHFPDNHIRVLVGCAPCQPFSKYTQGINAENDTKWGLLSEFQRLIEESQPTIISMENVPGLYMHQVFQRFIKSLADNGYYCASRLQELLVYCPEYGIPQHRKRLVLLASKLGHIRLISPTHQAENYRTVADAIGKLPPLAAGQADPDDPLHRSSSLSERNLARIQHSVPGGSWRDWPEELIADCHKEKSGKSYSSVYGRMVWDQPAPTITTQFYGYGNGRFGHPEQDRGLSLREGAILQSFRPDYQFIEKSDNYHFTTIGRMIGNAVPVRLGEIIGVSIQQHIQSHYG